MTAPDIDELEHVASAAVDIVDVVQSLAKSNSNLILEVLGSERFVEYEHYPPGDIFDPHSGGQYYFHAHPATREDYNDFGHFHLFLRPSSLRGNANANFDEMTSDRPGNSSESPPCIGIGDPICHLIGISMDQRGLPVGLFTTNRWVTNETWHPASGTIPLLGQFSIEGPLPSTVVNRWISAMPVVFRADIEALVRQRDIVVGNWRAQHPGIDVFEDRRLEVTSWKSIDLEARLAEIRNDLGLD